MLPLGVIDSVAYIGSLDLEVLRDRIVFPTIKTLYGVNKRKPEEATIKGKVLTGFKTQRPDVVIMNQPLQGLVTWASRSCLSREEGGPR